MFEGLKSKPGTNCLEIQYFARKYNKLIFETLIEKFKLSSFEGKIDNKNILR